MKPLPRSFYEQSVVTVARECIGKMLVHRTAEGITGGRIVEAEAYRGPEDLAAHSRGGLRTARTEVMYGPAGHAYVYLLYGTSWAFNFVCGPVDKPHAVLVRALEPLFGIELMAHRRGMTPIDRALTNGPGKLCAALAIDKQAYGTDLCGRSSALFVATCDAPTGPIGRSPRIHIDYAGSWVDKPWRFFEKRNRFLSTGPRE